MITEIGIVAGEIWHFLDKKEDVELRDLFAGIDKPKELILMSLGWLAREGHVIINNKKGNFRVKLREEE
ncbi:MAG: winged helix-turn-helix domain-containing protein [Candidatus Omnitrophica bacterium]|nr:winged helix-turn-helix domain-containing protein [Candidatus Omnitrophota bacterium]